jgi:hypothetical protein
MLRVRADSRGLTRRDFVHVGGLGAFGLALPTLLRAAEPRGSFGRAKRCVLLFLTGGPPQHDTWDMKPNAPERIRGELRPIATNVPGIQISELFPKLSRHADKLCIVRSVTHADRTHTSAGYTMLTGVPHPSANAATAANIRPGPHDHPHLGALRARVLPSRSGVPPFVALPEAIKDAGVNPYPGLDGGLLGNQFGPFRIEANAERTGFQFPDVFLPRNITAGRLEERRLLRERIEQTVRRIEATPIGDMDAWYRQAFDVMCSSGVREAFAIEREPAKLREQYGSHLFGQGCLLARRLMEAGVGLVAVYWHYEGPDDSPVWDTHQNNFPHLRERLMPPTDAAMSALLADLDARGMLDDTLVLCMGEFGRTPLVNRLGGRDHWSALQSVVLAGAGVRMGTTFGSSDRDGAYPAESPVTPADLTATLMYLLGIPADLEIVDRTNRPVRACLGSPVLGLLA